MIVIIHKILINECNLSPLLPTQLKLLNYLSLTLPHLSNNHLYQLFVHFLYIVEVTILLVLVLYIQGLDHYFSKVIQYLHKWKLILLKKKLSHLYIYSREVLIHCSNILPSWNWLILFLQLYQQYILDSLNKLLHPLCQLIIIPF